MIHMGRRPLYTVTDTQMRNLIFKYGIDENGLKVPLRELFSNPEFMEKSGYYQTTLIGMKKPVSIGSVPELNVKLKTQAKDMYKYYKKKGLVTMEFDEWLMSSRKNRKKYELGEVKALLIQFFCLGYELITEDVDKLLQRAREKYLDLGFTDEQFDEEFKYFLKSHEITYRQLTKMSSDNSNRKAR